MDPLTIAAAIAATKTLVKSARGVQEIVHGLDGVFHAQDEHEKNKKAQKHIILQCKHFFCPKCVNSMKNLNSGSSDKVLSCPKCSYLSKVKKHLDFIK